MGNDIPTSVYVEFIGRTIAIHWAYHAILMIVTWFVIVPIGVMAIRFFKPRPTLNGIERGTGLMWWTIHYSTLYLGIGLSLLGLSIAVFVSRGFSGSAHSMWGAATIVFGCLQIISAWNRGSHGGKLGPMADPDDPSTWRGDHFDMTPRRRWFEAYHKTAGYFTIALAFGAAGSGLMRYWMPGIAIAFGVFTVAVLILCVLLEGKGFRQDTYRSVYGTNPDNPYNRARRDL
jgi:hypothetical protein